MQGKPSYKELEDRVIELEKKYSYHLQGFIPFFKYSMQLLFFMKAIVKSAMAEINKNDDKITPKWVTVYATCGSGKTWKLGGAKEIILNLRQKVYRACCQSSINPKITIKIP